MRSLVAAIKMTLFFLWCLMMVPLQCLILLFTKAKASYIGPYIWHKGVCLILGLKVVVHGQPHIKEQTLYVSNHLSYLDIPVIGTVLQASFVAKKDVSSWPVFGFLSKLQQTAFIDRSRGAAKRESSALDAMIEAGKSLIIFPEGTSTDGRSVLPFKSSLFALALKDTNQHVLIQPFTIKMDEIDGQPPMSQNIIDIYSWHRDMTTELPAHLWRFAKSKGAVISLYFHPAISSEHYSDRKKLALVCQETVSSIGINNSKAA